ncbi:class I SAM-dependent DNA methyltransferase [Streptomyces finlayi]|uniref:class I SAM-dependent DNA methyltransferase n=1 Tax=Streptomyces finlayi TaxID=67296 RepID=UPI001E59868D|nr:class I SAM-dependent methyltransferase [Streptomyces finlayi]
MTGNPDSTTPTTPDAPEDGYFGASVAARYDDPDDGMFSPCAVVPAVDFLEELAAGGPALEFGVGTGRIALPLAHRGVPVHGIDLSRAMVERMREKEGGAELPVTIGDFATTRADGPYKPGDFTLVYLVFNTLMNLTTQEAQVACFRNAAAHLAPGGTFAVEVAVPDLRLLAPGQEAVPMEISATRWAFDRYEVATQSMSSNYIEVEGGRGSYRSIPFRYVWPAELDLMAQLAGLRLRDRWEGWRGERFDDCSGRHVSVWERPRG